LEIGEQQYNIFMIDRIEKKDKSLFDPIPKNKLPSSAIHQSE
jgi:hypothetical protein